jgi:hypothetical protein
MKGEFGKVLERFDVQEVRKVLDNYMKGRDFYGGRLRIYMRMGDRESKDSTEFWVQDDIKYPEGCKPTFTGRKTYSRNRYFATFSPEMVSVKTEYGWGDRYSMVNFVGFFSELFGQDNSDIVFNDLVDSVGYIVSEDEDERLRVMSELCNADRGNNVVEINGFTPRLISKLTKLLSVNCQKVADIYSVGGTEMKLSYPKEETKEKLRDTKKEEI